MENIHYDVVINYAAPKLTSTVNFITAEVIKPEQVYSVEFQNLTYLLLQIMREKDQTYNSAISEINEILILIDKELQKE
jgi:hypothetical protein